MGTSSLLDRLFQSFQKLCVDSISCDKHVDCTWFPAGFFAAEYIALDAFADWKLNFNTLDLILARGAFATRTVAITPFIAFRGAFIHQRFTTSYSQGGFFNESGAEITSVKMAMQNDFDGWVSLLE